MLNSKLLENKVALITGANRGIGKAILEKFASNGANIWACSRKKDADFELFLNELALKFKVVINPLYFDLRDEDQIKQTLKPLVINREPVDVLVNNAGIAHGSFFQMTSINQMKELFQINFFSQLLVTQLIVKAMQKQKRGSIINMSSIVGLDADAGFIAYGSSKAALIYATKTLAKELSIHNIRINAIAPGLTDTDMGDQMEAKAKEKMIKSSSMNRMATPGEIANTALFLASELSEFTNGQVLRVDGGI